MLETSAYLHVYLDKTESINLRPRELMCIVDIFELLYVFLPCNRNNIRADIIPNCSVKIEDLLRVLSYVIQVVLSFCITQKNYDSYRTLLFIVT
jgi:hypothetical protein